MNLLMKSPLRGWKNRRKRKERSQAILLRLLRGRNQRNRRRKSPKRRKSRKKIRKRSAPNHLLLRTRRTTRTRKDLHKHPWTIVSSSDDSSEYESSDVESEKSVKKSKKSKKDKKESKDRSKSFQKETSFDKALRSFAIDRGVKKVRFLFVCSVVVIFFINVVIHL